METFQQILSILGHVVRAIGFLILGFGIVRFTMDAYYKAVWQVQVALVVGFFILLIGLTHYSDAASMGMFAIGAGAAFLIQFFGKKEIEEEKPSKKK